MVERWYVTIRISETAGGDYAATEPDRPGVGRGCTPIRALVDYARTVERAGHIDRADYVDRADHAERADYADRADHADAGGREQSRETGRDR